MNVSPETLRRWALVCATAGETALALELIAAAEIASRLADELERKVAA